MADPATKRATIADLLALGDARFELIGGEILPKATPSYEHSDAQAAGVSFLRSRFHHGGGSGGPGGWWIVTECEIVLPHDEVYRPDLVGWRRDRVPERPRGRLIEIRPDWVCEVLSTSNARRDLVDKLRVYQRAGVPHYWIIDPQEQVLTVYRHSGATYEVALTATRGETIHAEPFDAVPLPVAILFGDDPEP
ncbi:MAG: Uma2 family endonuclease [Myxococcota bacterium]|nr:Uma2 family endonuclease [Myxococcota bacterium]